MALSLSTTLCGLRQSGKWRYIAAGKSERAKKAYFNYFLVPSCGTAKCDIDTRTTYLFIGHDYLFAKLAAVFVCFGKSNLSSLNSSGTTSRNSISVRSHFQDTARRSTACYYKQSRCKMNQPHITLQYAFTFIGPHTTLDCGTIGPMKCCERRIAPTFPPQGLPPWDLATFAPQER